MRSCLGLRYDDYEIVVCDNDVSSATEDLIRKYTSSRIRYVRAPRSLAMSSNWEFAVSHAGGDYVTVLGDDDAILPNAFVELDHILEQTGSAIVSWDAALYVWPTITLPGEENYLRLPILRGIRTLDGLSVIRSVLAFESSYTELPMLYNSVVSREFLSSVKDTTGRLFLSQCPDICSGFLLAYCAKSYSYVESPMSIAGLSHKSTGVSRHFLHGQSMINKDYEDLNRDERRYMHAMVPDLHVFPVIPVVDSFLAVKECMFPKDNSLSLNRKTMIRHCVWCLRTDNQEKWDTCMNTIRNSLDDDPELRKWFDTELASHPAQTGHLPLRNAFPGADDRYLHLNAERFSTTDVAEAAALCEWILGYIRRVSSPARTGHEPFDPLELFSQMLAGAGYQAQEIKRLRRETEIIPELRRSLDASRQELHCPRMVYRLIRTAFRAAAALFQGKKPT